MRRFRSQSGDAAVCSACGYAAASASFAYCPECGRSFVPARPGRSVGRIGWLSVPPMLYPAAYKWFILFSAADIVLTWFILLLGGTEVNVVADAVIASGGLKGLLGFKLSLAVLVVVICEVLGRRRPRTGRRLAQAGVGFAALPVFLSIAQWLMP